jgi:predicted transcriptional regulator
MEEARYRESRLCRLLGNPVIYRLVVLLSYNAPLTPTKLAGLTGRSIQTVSTHLAKLRAMDVVRYDTGGKEVRYWLKHKPEMKSVLNALGKVVEVSSELK